MKKVNFGIYLRDLHIDATAKKILLSLFLIFLINSNSFAGESPGYYINQNNEVIKVTFKIPEILVTGEANFAKIQDGIKYYDSNNKKRILKPHHAKEIGFHYLGEKIRMISIFDKNQVIGSIFNQQTHLFLRIKIDGKLKLYSFYTIKHSGYYAGPGMYHGSTSVEQSFILQKEGQPLFNPRSLYFKKDMREYLADCPELVDKIENKEYKLMDMEEIVTEYNIKCNPSNVEAK